MVCLHVLTIRPNATLAVSLMVACLFRAMQRQLDLCKVNAWAIIVAAILGRSGKQQLSSRHGRKLVDDDLLAHQIADARMI